MKIKIRIEIKKILWVLLGCMGVGLGTIGSVMPMLPAFPFLLLAAYSFARSSERLHTWFVNTKLYKKNLESYVQGRGMTRATKIRIMIMVTLLMSFSCLIMLMKGVYFPCLILGGVWVFHIFYFSFGVKTLIEE